MTAYQVIESLGGIELESAYPYKAKDQQCQFDKSKVAISASNAEKIGNRNEDQMKQYVSSTGPLSICHDAAIWSSYRGGIMTSCKSGGGHCTQIVGYGTEGGQSYLKVRNSWGSSFGESGHARLIYGKNLCGITQLANTVKATAVGPTPPPTPTPQPTPGPTPQPTPPAPTPQPTPPGMPCSFLKDGDACGARDDCLFCPDEGLSGRCHDTWWPCFGGVLV